MVSERLAGDYSDILQMLHRDSVANGLRIHRILEHLALPPVTEEEVDEALDHK